MRAAISSGLRVKRRAAVVRYVDKLAYKQAPTRARCTLAIKKMKKHLSSSAGAHSRRWLRDIIFFPKIYAVL